MSRKNNRTNNIATNLSVPYETVRAAPERIHEVFPFLSCIVLTVRASLFPTHFVLHRLLLPRLDPCSNPPLDYVN